MARAVHEREITSPVSLTLPDGRLNPGAVGWTRTRQITTDRIGRGLRGLGRNKRWEYWAVTTPTHIVALVTSDIDYAAVHGIWCLARATGEAIAHDAIGVLGAVSVATACLLPAGPAAELTQVPDGDEKLLSVEHPTGEMSVIVTMRDGAVTNAAVLRTARKLFDGYIFP